MYQLPCMHACNRNYVVWLYTLSILDSGTGSFKLGVGAKPLLQINIFLRRKDNDFFAMALLLSSKQTSFPLLIIRPLLRCRRSSLCFKSLVDALLVAVSNPQLDNESRILSNGRLGLSSSGIEPCSAETCLCNNDFNSFWSFPTSSGVRSCRWSWEEGRLPWRLCFSGSSFTSFFPNVPIARSPWGQSLNSSFWGSCWHPFSVIKEKLY